MHHDPRALASESVILAAPFSFAGSTRRIWRGLRPRVTPALSAWGRLGWWSLIWTVLVFAWLGVLVWYCAFGLVLWPYRIIRRTQRHGERNRLRHRELTRD